jgi:hypothetical protein
LVLYSNALDVASTSVVATETKVTLGMYFIY